MSETSQLIHTIKRLLKAQGMTYKDVAHQLNISEPSVKRLFSSEKLTVERLEKLSHIVGFTLSELTREAILGKNKIDHLSIQQEKQLVSDGELFLVAVCALNQWSMQEIVDHYRINQQQCLKHLLKLDIIGIIDLLPGNRIRLNVSRNFDWLPMGPIRQYFQQRAQDHFLQNPFEQENETLAFVYAMLTDQALAEFHQEVLRLRQRLAQLHEQSLTAPLAKRQGVGCMLAVRPWEPAGFAELKRHP